MRTRRLGQPPVSGQKFAERHFLQALDLLAEDSPAERSLVAVDRCFLADRRGDMSRAATLATEALTLAEASQDPVAIAQAHNVLGILANHRGQRAAARHRLEQASK